MDKRSIKMNDLSVLNTWLNRKELIDLYYPIKIDKLVKEIKSKYNYTINKDNILRTLKNELIYKIFENPKGHKGKNRPHCLYLFSSDYVGIDQEDCIRNALKLFLNEKDFKVFEEIGFIDLIAEKDNDCWLFEVKGKQTYEFTNLAFAQGIEQCFPIKVDDNIFKLRKSIGFGNSITKKGHLFNYPTDKKKHITILIPGFNPTIVWKNSTDQKLSEQVYNREVNEFKNLINGKNTFTTFQKYLIKINNQFNIVSQYNRCKDSGWCFHLLKFNGLYENRNFTLLDAINNNILDFLKDVS